jgi:hypothetical protein
MNEPAANTDKVAAVLLAVALLILVLIALPAWFWHPLGYCTGTPSQVVACKGYNLWSGIAGSFLTSLPGWAVALLVFMHQRNCHVKGCWRFSWHPHPDHGHPVCKPHHPHDPAHLDAIADEERAA